MEVQIEDSIPAKKRKNDEPAEETGEKNASDEPSDPDDNEIFLQEYLRKRPQNDLTPYQQVIQHEEELPENEETPYEDLTKLYKGACADLSAVVNEIADLKATKPEGWKDTINELRIEGAMITIVMKKLNRVEKARTKLNRERIAKEKQQMDVTRVGLDNMLAEISHLQKEIDKCLKFGSNPLGIDLVPIEEFYEKAPESISKPEITKTDSHALQLARLEWELHQRKELAKLLSDLESKESFVSEQIAKREKDLNSIGPLVNEIASVAQPLKDKLALSSTADTVIADHAYLLPEPLYFLFVQVSAFRDAADKDIVVEIRGNFAEAQRFRHQNADDFESSLMAAKGSISKLSINEEKSQLLTKHPLSVYLKLSIKDGYSLELQFFYFPILQIATVKPSLITPSSLKIPSSADVILNPNNILNNLFAGDSGLESPNLMNFYQLQKFDLESLPFDSMGLPYIWVQKFVGLNFLGQNKKVDPKMEICRGNLPTVIKELKRRCLHRSALLSLISDIEDKNIIAPDMLSSVKLSCQLQSFKGITWAEYLDSPLSARFRDSPYVSSGDLHFQAVITRGEAKLLCLIAVKPDYPLAPCIFAVDIEFETLSQDLKTYCLEIEKEVNVHWTELLTCSTQAVLLLNYQLFKTMLCFDVTLESLDSEIFPTSKKFDSKFRGRERTLPFRYIPEEEIFVHRK